MLFYVFEGRRARNFSLEKYRNSSFADNYRQFKARTSSGFCGDMTLEGFRTAVACAATNGNLELAIYCQCRERASGNPLRAETLHPATEAAGAGCPGRGRSRPPPGANFPNIRIRGDPLVKEIFLEIGINSLLKIVYRVC